VDTGADRLNVLVRGLVPAIVLVLGVDDETLDNRSLSADRERKGILAVLGGQVERQTSLQGSKAQSVAGNVDRELGSGLVLLDPVDLQSRAELTLASHRDRREGEELVLAGGLVLGRQTNTSDVSLQLELGVGRLL